MRVIFGLSCGFTVSLKSCCKNEPYVQRNPLQKQNNQMISSYGDDSDTLSFDNQDRDT